MNNKKICEYVYIYIRFDTTYCAIFNHHYRSRRARNREIESWCIWGDFRMRWNMVNGSLWSKIEEEYPILNCRHIRWIWIFAQFADCRSPLIFSLYFFSVFFNGIPFNWKISNCKSRNRIWFKIVANAIKRWIMIAREFLTGNLGQQWVA